MAYTGAQQQQQQRTAVLPLDMLSETRPPSELYDLPPMVDTPTSVSTVRGMPIRDLAKATQVVQGLVRSGDASALDNAKAALLADPNVAVAMAQFLHEIGVLLDASGQPVPPPIVTAASSLFSVPPPQLQPPYRSWLACPKPGAFVSAHHASANGSAQQPQPLGPGMGLMAAAPLVVVGNPSTLPTRPLPRTAIPVTALPR